MIAFYRVLLLLYPASFRNDYRDEMTALFAGRVAGAGILERIALAFGAVADTVPHALAEHWHLLKQDLRYIRRSFGRAPGFAMATIAVIAVGVGANTAAFSAADLVLFRPLPFHDPNSLIRLCWGPRAGGGWGCNNQLSPANYRDYRDMTSSFTSLGAYTRTSANLVGAGVPKRLALVSMTSEVLPLLGITPMLGRVFDSASVDAREIIIAHDFWRSQLGADPGIVGRTVRLNGTPFTVIGVMPPAFNFPRRDVNAWTHLVLREGDFEDRGNNYLEAVGRLRPGTTMDQARAELQVVADRLARDYPEINADAGFTFFAMRDELSPRSRVMLFALCGASLCILLLTCANLANLLLARAGARERELAVRSALGAGRERLVRQLITESMTIAVIGGVAGLGLAAAVVPLLALLVPTTLPVASQPSLDLRMLALGLGFTVLTGLGFGLVPAFKLGGRNAFDALREGVREGGGRKQRLRSVLVGVEVAISVALVISSGLLIRAVWRVQTVDPGFVAERVITLRTTLPRPKYDLTNRRLQFYRQVLTAVRGLPGVEYAGYATGLPIVMQGRVTGIALPGREQGSLYAGEIASIRFVMPGYFQAMGIPLIRGRDVEDGDIQDRTPVAVVSQSFADRYWPGEDPLGKSFDSRGGTRTVIGVVGDIKGRGLERNSEPQMYASAGQVPDTAFTNDDPKDLVIRTSASMSVVLPAVREIVRAADPEQPISDVRTLEDVVAGETAPRRAQLRILVALASVAVAVSAIGIYGLLAYTVAQRRREIGVRMALGAEPLGIVRLVVSQGMWLAVVGIIPGVVGAWFAGRGMSSMLFGVAPADPATIIAAVGLVLVMTLAGSFLPVLRATKVNPTQALRVE